MSRNLRTIRVCSGAGICHARANGACAAHSMHDKMLSVVPPAGFSKFLSGVAGAKASPRVVLAGGLMATAAVNLAFGFGASYAWFLACWGANGLLQGLGAPACAR